jgi:hypothetical protein
VSVGEFLSTKSELVSRSTLKWDQNIRSTTATYSAHVLLYSISSPFNSCVGLTAADRHELIGYS